MLYAGFATDDSVGKLRRKDIVAPAKIKKSTKEIC